MIKAVNLAESFVKRYNSNIIQKHVKINNGSADKLSQNGQYYFDQFSDFFANLYRKRKKDIFVAERGDMFMVNCGARTVVVDMNKNSSTKNLSNTPLGEILSEKFYQLFTDLSVKTNDIEKEVVKYRTIV